MAIARSLVAGQGFANPFSQFPTGPTAICAPVHPAMLAAILALAGDRPIAAIPLVLVEVAIQVAGLVLLLRISAAMFSTWIPGAIAAAAMLVCTQPVPEWENATAQLALEILFVCVLSGRSARWTGAGMGLGWLVSPALIPVSLAAVLLTRGWKYAMACTGIAAVIVAPWMVRNWRVFHAPVFLRDNFGLELFISNNDRAGPRQQDAPERYQLWHPSQNAAAAAELRSFGEPRYFNLLQAEALRWMRTHPRRFLQLTAERAGLWWASTWTVAAINLLGLVGLWMSRRTSMAKALAAGFLLYPAPYYVVQFDPRYTWSVLWLSALMTGYTGWVLFRRLVSSQIPQRPPSRPATILDSEGSGPA